MEPGSQGLRGGDVTGGLLPRKGVAELLEVRSSG